MSLQAQSLLRFSCSILSTLASDTDILTLIDARLVAPNQTHTYTDTHTCVHNTTPQQHITHTPRPERLPPPACLRDRLQEPCFSTRHTQRP